MTMRINLQWSKTRTKTGQWTLYLEALPLLPGLLGHYDDVGPDASLNPLPKLLDHLGLLPQVLQLLKKIGLGRTTGTTAFVTLKIVLQVIHFLRWGF